MPDAVASRTVAGLLPKRNRANRGTVGILSYGMSRSSLHNGYLGPVLIAGGGGFIGRRLVELLDDLGIEVVAPSRRECDLRRRESTRALFEKYRPDTIVNVARSTHAADPRDHEEHIGMARRVLEAGWVAGDRRLIQIGSSTEFGCTGVASGR